MILKNVVVDRYNIKSLSFGNVYTFLKQPEGRIGDVAQCPWV